MTDHENELVRLATIDGENEADNDWLEAIQSRDWGGEISLAEGNEIASEGRTEIIASIHELNAGFRNELDRLRRQKEAMRDAFHALLEKASDHTVFNDEDQVPECTCCGVELHQDGTGHRENCLALAILQESKCLSDTAADYISKESVKPLVEALRKVLANLATASYVELDGDFISESGCKELNDSVRAALTHAKSIGLPTEKEGT